MGQNHTVSEATYGSCRPISRMRCIHLKPERKDEGNKNGSLAMYPGRANKGEGRVAVIERIENSR